MKSHGNYIIMLALCKIAMGQGLRNESAVIRNNNASIYIAGAGQGHYTSNGTGSIIPVNSPSMVVYGNWVNNASNTGFGADAGTVYMDGTNQDIGGANPTVFYNLTLRNGGVKTMTNNISVGGVTTLTGLLDLTDAELNLNQYTLTITNPNMTIARTTGYINSENGCGTCNVWSSAVTWSIGTATGARVIPFGVSNTYIPMTFNKMNAVNTNITVSTHAAAADNTPLPLAVTHMNVPAMSITQANDGTNTVIDRWWFITPSTSSTSPVDLDLDFTYRGGENTCTGGPQTGNFGAQYWANYGGSNYGWFPCAGPSWTCSTMGTWPGVTSGTQNATSTTGVISLPLGNLSTSYWVLSSKINPLPIEITWFRGECQTNKSVLLQWQSASEVNALNYEVERSRDALTWTLVNTVPAKYPNGGNYSIVDAYTEKGIVYYRLKMVDKDGTFKYSSIIDVAMDNCKNIRTNVYGISKDVVADIYTSLEQDVRIVVIDAVGRILVNEPLHVTEGGNQFKIPMNVANGIYFVKVIDQTGDVLAVEKVILKD